MKHLSCSAQSDCWPVSLWNVFVARQLGDCVLCCVGDRVVAKQQRPEHVFVPLTAVVNSAPFTRIRPCGGVPAYTPCADIKTITNDAVNGRLNRDVCMRIRKTRVKRPNFCIWMATGNGLRVDKDDRTIR